MTPVGANEPTPNAEAMIRELFLADEAATMRLGADLALVLRAGDVVALSGDLGAGKSTLARALIRALAGDPDLEVPSPTYTLVQSYDTAPPAFHFDLYRLADPSELAELGFEEAAETGIVLCEWPEQGGVEKGANLSIRLEAPESGCRRVGLSGTAETIGRVARSLDLRAFLARSGNGAAPRRRLFGDASPRRYEAVAGAAGPLVLMDAPALPKGPLIRHGRTYNDIAHRAETIVPFLAIAKALRHEGFHAPAIHDFDLAEGLVLLEDLGRDGLLDAEGEPIPERYEAAVRCLAAIHGRSWPDSVEVAPDLRHEIPSFDRDALTIEIELLIDFYFPSFFGRPARDDERQRYLDVWGRLFDHLDESEKSLLLRDVHSPNVLWCEAAEGIGKVGLIDFQDAMIGPSAYDVASLAQDARVTIPEEMELRLLDAYAEARRTAGRFDEVAFRRAYAITAAQRGSKILGGFVRSSEHDGKSQYLRHIPRMKAYLRRTLKEEVLKELSSLYGEWGLTA
ncbi:tRNA (adenosine(37)-N6)-threonylcarbamoyltransferase complex ATPase subunit type 1 TsaE [Consotaella salsifontis]|uniref:tRNA threonylcarbamoyladenosine biosynthesis protein TsaE n=1 Tax=Consotaella salsifontis TaxID=1365950 RepID=A0A1T4QI25_9HYPH|nr:tRNA (adenosine(37)-N6)-threonylcarbamoyltransferase complex ATPase subunit type 1 TsaE [Consotaella salsifontis]SKA03369.1 hypothetical protein SAMN05428963_10560 [Consotaella salsifontis]